MTESRNNSFKQPKDIFPRRRYGDYGYIYYKHTVKLRVMYGIQNLGYLCQYGIEKKQRPCKDRSIKTNKKYIRI